MDKTPAQIVAERTTWHNQGLTIDYRTTFDEWQAIGETLLTMDRTLQWALGDWINFGERRFGEKYLQALEETSYTHGHLRNVSWVTKSFPPDRRRPELTFYHHTAVAALDSEMQDMWLDDATLNGWSVLELRKRLKGDREGEDPKIQKCIDIKAFESLVGVMQAVRDGDIEEAQARFAIAKVQNLVPDEVFTS